MQYPKIISLDIGTQMGWAYAEGNKILSWGTADMSTTPGSPNNIGEKAQKAYEWMRGWYGVDEIYYERVGGFQNSQGAIESYYGILAGIQWFSGSVGIFPKCVFTSTLKKEFLGYGGKDATKFKMCQMCHRLGWKGGYPGTDRDHNAADAIALIVCLQRKQGNEITFA